MLNIVLDQDIVLNLLSRSQNDTQHCFVRLQKPHIRFWVPCCLLSVLEMQIHSSTHQPLSTLFNKNIQWLSSLAAHWDEIPADCPNKAQAQISLDAAALPGTTILWTNHPDFISVHPNIECGDHEFVYGMLAQHEEELSLVDLVSQQLAQRPKLEKQIFSVLQQRQYLGGTVVTNLENELANFIGAKHCVCVGSGTSALLIALLAINIKTGDEVIISPFDVIASAQMIALLGAKPVFVDIEPATYTLDPLLLKSAITSKTKAIIAANVFGQCADFNSINEVANQHSLPVIENAAQSVGATYHNLNAGTLSTIGCTSFSPAQPLSTYGEGGACFTNDDELANKMRQLRDHGQTRHNYYQTIGINSPLNTLQASLLLAKLQIFPQELESRTQIAANYTRLLKESVKTPMIAAHNTSVYSQYAIEVKNRHDIQQQLQKQDIPTAVPIALPIHLLPAFARPDVGNFPIAEQVTPCILGLPMHPYLTLEVQTEIINALKSVL